jgi:RimJ/RimL family protein N-acetyltransferase
MQSHRAAGPRSPAGKGYDVSAVRLRPAQAADGDRLWQWRNEPTTRQASLNTAEVSLEDHLRWLAGQLDSPDVALFIVEEATHGAPCGQVRLDRVAGGDAVVSLSIASEWRGRGLGVAALRALLEPSNRPFWARRLLAVIRLSNEASRRAFERAGFVGPHPAAIGALAAVPADAGVWVSEG